MEVGYRSAWNPWGMCLLDLAVFDKHAVGASRWLDLPMVAGCLCVLVT